MRTLATIVAAVAMAMPACGAFAQSSPAYDLDIVHPAEEATVFNDKGDVVVNATLVPDLAAGDRVELLIDGVPAAPPSKSLQVPISSLTRGQHLLQARIIDATGNVGAISPSVTFYVWQSSPLFPNPRGK